MNEELYNELVKLNNAISKHQDLTNNFFFKYGNMENCLPRGFETGNNITRVRDLLLDIQKLLISFSALNNTAIKTADMVANNYE